MTPDDPPLSADDSANSADGPADPAAPSLPADSATPDPTSVNPHGTNVIRDVPTAVDDIDPPYVPDREVFGSYTHRELWGLVHEALDPGALGQAADVWRGNADVVGEAFRTFSASANAEFARWSGQARDAALRATLDFVARGAAVPEVCVAVQRRLEADAEAAQVIRDAIPPPPQPYQPLEDPVAEAVHGGRRRMEHDTQAATAQADVRDVMTFVYNPTLPASGDRVPRFAPAPRGPGSSGGHE